MIKPYFRCRQRSSWPLSLIAAVCLSGAGLSMPASAEGDAASSGYDDPHAFRWKIRGSAWFAMMEGDFETRNRLNNKVSFSSEDLDYDEPYITPQFEAAFRYKKHDFWVVGTLFDEGETTRLGVEFEFDDITIPISVPFQSDLDVTDINFRYGYAFRTIEENGYRLGPYIGVSYTDFEFAGGIPGTSIGGSYDDTFPIPTFGAYAEVPWGKALISSSIGGIWFESGNFEGAGLRAEIAGTYRFHKNVGLYAGVYLMYVDIELKKQKLDDFLLWGPNVGLEFRF